LAVALVGGTAWHWAALAVLVLPRTVARRAASSSTTARCCSSPAFTTPMSSRISGGSNRWTSSWSATWQRAIVRTNKNSREGGGLLLRGGLRRWRWPRRRGGSDRVLGDGGRTGGINTWRDGEGIWHWHVFVLPRLLLFWGCC